jgi:hypothetical protein
LFILLKLSAGIPCPSNIRPAIDPALSLSADGFCSRPQNNRRIDPSDSIYSRLARRRSCKSHHIRCAGIAARCKVDPIGNDTKLFSKFEISYVGIFGNLAGAEASTALPLQSGDQPHSSQYFLTGLKNRSVTVIHP